MIIFKLSVSCVHQLVMATFKQNINSQFKRKQLLEFSNGPLMLESPDSERGKTKVQKLTEGDKNCSSPPPTELGPTTVSNGVADNVFSITPNGIADNVFSATSNGVIDNVFSATLNEVADNVFSITSNGVTDNVFSVTPNEVTNNVFSVTPKRVADITVTPHNVHSACVIGVDMDHQAPQSASDDSDQKTSAEVNANVMEL